VRARGFTLVEVILAVTILALVMGLIFGSFFSQTRVSQAARSEIGTDQRARLVMEQLGRDVSQLLAVSKPALKEPVLSGRPLIVGGRPGHELALITRTGPMDSDGRLAGEPVVRVVYLTEPAPVEGQGPLIIVRRQASLLQSGQERSEVLCRGVAGLKVIYLTAQGGETEAWEEDKKEPPPALRIELALAAADGQVATYNYLTGPLTALTWKPGK